MRTTFAQTATGASTGESSSRKCLWRTSRSSNRNTRVSSVCLFQNKQKFRSIYSWKKALAREDMQYENSWCAFVPFIVVMRATLSPSSGSVVTSEAEKLTITKFDLFAATARPVRGHSQSLSF